MKRPHPDCNHTNWQLGHLIQSDHQMVSAVAPGKMPPLPDGFAEMYAKETASSDDPSAFLKKGRTDEAGRRTTHCRTGGPGRLLR